MPKLGHLGKGDADKGFECFDGPVVFVESLCGFESSHSSFVLTFVEFLPSTKLVVLGPIDFLIAENNELSAFGWQFLEHVVLESSNHEGCTQALLEFGQVRVSCGDPDGAVVVSFLMESAVASGEVPPIAEFGGADGGGERPDFLGVVFDGGAGEA